MARADRRQSARQARHDWDTYEDKRDRPSDPHGSRQEMENQQDVVHWPERNLPCEESTFRRQTLLSWQ